MAIKRKSNPHRFDFATFADDPMNSDTFRDNITVFLQNSASVEDYKVDGMSVYCTYLLHDGKNIAVPLFTVEENVEEPFNSCDHCRYAGWSKKFLTMKTYHFIIPADESWNKGIDRVLDQRHLLHGLIHYNGFGHLMCINGIQGGSKYLFGKEIMDLWDRICTSLRTRKITVLDASKKFSMDLRLLYGVAYGHPWFGRWGYKFCRGSFGVSENKYVRAIKVLSSIELDSMVQDFGNGNGSEEIKELVQYYRDLSETHVITVRDLLRTMLTLKWRVPAQKNPTTVVCAASPLSCRTPTQNSQQHKYFAEEKLVRCRNFVSCETRVEVYKTISFLFENFFSCETTEATKRILECRLLCKKWGDNKARGVVATHRPYHKFVSKLLAQVRPKKQTDEVVVSSDTHTSVSEIVTINELMDAHISRFAELHDEEFKIQDKQKDAFDLLLKFEAFSFTLTAGAYLTSAITHAPCKCKGVIALGLCSSILVMLVPLVFYFFRIRSLQPMIKAFGLKRAEFVEKVRPTLRSYGEVSYSQWAYGPGFVEASNISTMKTKASILRNHIKHTSFKYLLVLAFFHIFLVMFCTMIFDVIIPWIVFRYKCR